MPDLQEMPHEMPHLPPLPALSAVPRRAPVPSAHTLLQDPALRSLQLPPDQAMQDHEGMPALHPVPDLQAMPPVQALPHAVLSVSPLLPDLPVENGAPKRARVGSVGAMACPTPVGLGATRSRSGT